MRESRNKLTEKEMELARMLMSECNTTADVQSKLKRLFAGTIEQMLEEGFLHGSPLLYDRLRERRAGKLDFAAVVLGGMPREIPLPHQTVYIDRNQIGLDMADFNDVAR